MTPNSGFKIELPSLDIALKPKDSLSLTSFGLFPHKVIGRGTFSLVFAAEDQSHNQFAVKKIYRPKEALHESHPLQCIPRHPNLILMYNIFNQPGLTPHERIDFEVYKKYQLNLEQLITCLKLQNRPFPPNLFLEIIKKLLHGLAHIHAHDYVHRDIKPSNILLSFPVPKRSSSSTKSDSSSDSCLSPMPPADRLLGQGGYPSLSAIDMYPHPSVYSFCTLPDKHCTTSKNGACNGASRISPETAPHSIFYSDDSSAEVEVVISDMTHMTKMGQSHPTAYLFARNYRAPELLLGFLDYTDKVDVWALGATFAEMARMKKLFKGKNSMEVLSRIVKIAGEIPPPLAHKYSGVREKLGDGQGSIDRKLKSLDEKVRNLIKRMLDVDEQLRPTAQLCLDLLK